VLDGVDRLPVASDEQPQIMAVDGEGRLRGIVTADKALDLTQRVIQQLKSGT